MYVGFVKLQMMLVIIKRPPDKSVYWKTIIFIYHESKTYAVGTQKNRLNETVLLSTQKHP